jgi:hypothetical protein
MEGFVILRVLGGSGFCWLMVKLTYYSACLCVRAIARGLRYNLVLR